MIGPQNDGLTVENLKKLYVEDDNATLSSVGEILGCSNDTIRRWLKRYGLPIKPKFRYGPKKSENEKLADRDWLIKELEGKTAKQVAIDLGTTVHDVWFWSKKHGITDESKSVAISKALKKRYPKGRFGEQAANWQGGQVELPNGYIYVHSPDHPNATKAGYVMLHRLIAEEKIGRLLRKDEVVHHADGNKRNNDPGNLIVMKRGQHISDHFDALAELARAKARIAELESGEDVWEKS